MFAAIGLAMRVEPQIDDGLPSQAFLTGPPDRHDLPQRQRSKFRHIAGAQDPMALFFAKQVEGMEMTSLREPPDSSRA
jgi:hypothetical protein